MPDVYPLQVGMDSGGSYNGRVGFSPYTSDGEGDHAHTISGDTGAMSANDTHTTTVTQHQA